MDIEQVCKEINNSVDELDLVTARKYIEENIDLLQSKGHYLNKNARELLKVITDMHNSDYKPLQRNELAIINTINAYATKFDLRGLKLLVKENSQLLLREDLIPYFNKDAIIVLEGMGAISKH
ncbi:hypothetical protein RGU12_21610 [Fredinandcohnia sp. QZ13]|uniref:hypothetical protein n=1 Tax=Fredinandcohnia sp. QZ13 TaxID=3073144 RepID=UPI0028536037|nr:hypothetical protein [Fredinandcohnia sp. QZ13]MDR4890098.1 hypothetical protein [Fredinandcohnia sp. QZ13]